MRNLSRSILCMLLFDFVAVTISPIFWYKHFALPNTYLCQIILFLLVTFGIFVNFLKGHYKIREFNINKKNTYLLFEGCILAHIPALILLIIFADNINNSLQFISINLLTVFLLLFVYRVLYHIYLFYFKQTKNILIIGTDKNARLMSDEIINKQALKMNVVGFVEDSKSTDKVIESDNIKVFKQNSNLKKIIADNKVNIIIVAIHRRIEEQFLTQMIDSIPRNVKLYTMPDFYEMVTGKFYIDKMSVNGLFFNFMKNRSLIYDIEKRLFDVIASLIILIVTLPITLTTAVRVWLTDGWNPIYTQKRVGQTGQVFNCYKLRTMYANDFLPQKDNIEHRETQENDDRVIPFCKFVRKARFDEIPQMINILKGEMSIVGPRAEWEDLVKIYSQEVKGYACRMWSKTGWTGWAQINQGHCVSTEDITEKLQYDLYYLKHRNLLWEISILVKAVFLALGGRHD